MKKNLLSLIFILACFCIQSQTGVVKPAWELLGNTTNSLNFIGTKNAQPLIFKTNNLTRFTITSAGAVYNTGVATGTSNVFFGPDVNNVTYAGIESAVFGNNTAKNMLTGNGNSFFGAVTARSFTNSGQNCVFGSDAISSATVSSGNCVMGVQALSSYTGLGYMSVIGLQSMRNITTGSMNIGIGYRAAENFTNGTGNIFLGMNTSSLTTGNYNTLIGSNIVFPATSFSNNIILGDGQGNIRYRYSTNGTRIGSGSLANAVLHLDAGSSSIPAIALTSQSSVTTPTNGNIWYDAALQSFVFYHSDATGSTNNFAFANSQRTLNVYAPATASASTPYGFQITSSDGTGIGISPNGTLRMGVGTATAFISRPTTIGATTAPTTTLTVAGNMNSTGAATIGGILTAVSTESLGPALLTGGNSGTVAVVTDLMFSTTHFHSLVTSTVTSATLFFDKSFRGTCNASNNGCGITYIPFNATLVGFSLSNNVFGQLGSATNSTISVRVNNTTDILLTNVARYSAATQTYSSNVLNTNVSAGDYVEIKGVISNTPTGASNFSSAVTLYWKRR